MTLLESTEPEPVIGTKPITVANPITPPQPCSSVNRFLTRMTSTLKISDDDPTNNRLVATFNRTLAGVSLAFLPFILNDDHIYLEMAPNIIEPGERLPVGIIRVRHLQASCSQHWSSAPEPEIRTNQCTAEEWFHGSSGWADR